MKKYGLGIIGFGGMANHHTEHIAINEQLDIIGIYDIDEKRCNVAREKGYKIFESADALLQDEKIDIVLVATPNNFHEEYCLKSLAAGKATICEKPVTMCSGELETIMKYAEKVNGIFTIHQNRRMDKDYLMVKKAVADGLMGKVFSIESRVQGSRGVPEGWRQYEVAGGGMMLDWGVHLIDQIMMMIPEKVVSVFTHMFRINYDVDDNFKLFLRFESGISAVIEVGTSNFITLPRWYVAGEKGAMVINDWNCEGKIIRAKETTQEWEEEIVYTKAGPTKTMAPRRKDTIEEIALVEPDNDYTLTYQNLIDCIKCGAKPLVDPKEAMRVMKVMEAAFLSDKTGEAKKVNI